MPFSRCSPYFEAGMLFGGFGSTRMRKSNVGCRENPYFEKLADLGQIWPYSMYRADWEPATTSGKCMAGVPGVFWRSLAVLWGPTTHNSALV